MNMRGVLHRGVCAMSLTALLMILSVAALAADAVTPMPTVNGMSNQVEVSGDQPKAILSWNLSRWAKGQIAEGGPPLHVFYELKFGSDFVSGDSRHTSDRKGRVATGSGLPLSGKVSLDLAGAGRGPGVYFARIVAKRGGDTPESDVARRSPSVKIVWSKPAPQSPPTAPVTPPKTPRTPKAPRRPGQAESSTPVTLVLEPWRGSIEVPGGRLRFVAVLAGVSGEIDWTVKGGNAFGKIIPDFEDSHAAELVAPDTLPAGTKLIRISAQLRGTPSIDARAEVSVLRTLSPQPGRTPVGPAPNPTTPAATIDLLSVQELMLAPAQPQAGQAYQIKVTLRNGCAESVDLPYRVTLDGQQIAEGVRPNVPARRTAEISINRTAAQALTAGAHELTTTVDPENSLGEPQEHRGNNSRSLALTIDAISTTPGSDRVMVLDLTSTPAEPMQGHQYTLKLTLKNLTSASIAGLRYTIVMDGGNLLVDRTMTLPRGERSIIPIAVNGNFIQGAGPRHFFVDVDPDNALGELANHRGNNQRDLFMTVRAAPQPSTELETRDFDLAAAIAAGAPTSLRFVTDGDPSETPTQSGASGTVFDSNTSNPTVAFAVESPVESPWMAVHLEWINDPSGPLPNIFAGANDLVADPLLFSGFRLKHGWKVESCEFFRSDDEIDAAHISELLRPDQGTNSPAVGFHAIVPENRQLTLFIKMKIRGPKGYDPYR